ncbi:MAG: molybdopterin-synthase adenylyltransferase MoeB [Lachnospiraceae bacterium]|jgi:adenylyltransferase/sulfurtransferase|nr:molybdopterin-synthase adenylyltransferase MoeB [Lachnospiraceae bacterium]
MVTVLIPAALRSFTERQSEIEVEAATVGAAIKAVAEKYPDIAKHLYKEDGSLRDFINVFLGEENVKNKGGLETTLNDGDVIMLVPAIAGGSGETDTDVTLSHDEIARYSRHLLLPEIGIEGQKKLKAAKVLIVGTGGLGSPLALYLAAAGVGTLGLIDLDFVDDSNLQRQIIHGVKDVGRPKVASAQDRIKGINPFIKVETYNARLTGDNALDIIEKYDIVADGTDNYQTRYIVNDACVILGKPNVYGSVFQFEGQVSVFHAAKGPCYRCLYPAPPPPDLVPSCAVGGVLGVLPGIVGTLQANEVIKLIIGADSNPLVGRLLAFDAWKMRFRELKLEKDANCPICGEHPTITELASDEQICEFCGMGQKQEEDPIPEIAPLELKERLDSGEALKIIDIREPHERAIVKFIYKDSTAQAIPEGQLVRRQEELGDSAVILCKEGKKSIRAIRELRENDCKCLLFNLKDGINGWAREVDPSLPVY